MSELDMIPDVGIIVNVDRLLLPGRPRPVACQIGD